MIKIPKPKVRNLLNLGELYETIATLYNNNNSGDDNFVMFDHFTIYKTRRLFRVISIKPDILVSFKLSRISDKYYFNIVAGSDWGNAREFYSTQEEVIDIDDFKEELKRHEDIVEEFTTVTKEIMEVIK